MISELEATSGVASWHGAASSSSTRGTGGGEGQLKLATRTAPERCETLATRNVPLQFTQPRTTSGGGLPLLLLVLGGSWSCRTAPGDISRPPPTARAPLTSNAADGVSLRRPVTFAERSSVTRLAT